MVESAGQAVPNGEPISTSQVQDSWSEYRRLVLSELERLDVARGRLEAGLADAHNTINARIAASAESVRKEVAEGLKDTNNKVEAVSSKLNAVQQDIALLNARAAQLGAIWGVTASVIASLVVWLIQRLFEK